MIRRTKLKSMAIFLVYLTACVQGSEYISTVEGQSTSIVAQNIGTPTKPISTITAEYKTKEPGILKTNSPSPTQDTESVEAIVVIVMKDLSDRLDTDSDRIILKHVEPVNWHDSSLGCPQSDGVYTQVITPGLRILLEVDSQRYTYHSDLDQSFVLCNGDRLPIEPVPLMPVAPKGKLPKCQRTPCP